jgi:hypothetical protein
VSPERFPGHAPRKAVAPLGKLSRMGWIRRRYFGDERALAIALAAYGHVFTKRHRHHSTNQRGKARGQYRPRCGGCSRHADYDRGDGNDSVIGAENSGAQPVQTLRKVVAVVRFPRVLSGRGRLVGIAHATMQPSIL